MGTTDDAEQVSVSLPREDWNRIHAALLLTAMRTKWEDEAEQLMAITPEIHEAGGSEMMEAAEMEAREALGMPVA